MWLTIQTEISPEALTRLARVMNIILSKETHPAVTNGAKRKAEDAMAPEME